MADYQADYQENVSSCLPFYDLTDREFNAMVGNWPDRRHDLDLYDLSQIQINSTSATQI